MGILWMVISIQTSLEGIGYWWFIFTLFTLGHLCIFCSTLLYLCSLSIDLQLHVTLEFIIDDALTCVRHYFCILFVIVVFNFFFQFHVCISYASHEWIAFICGGTSAEIMPCFCFSGPLLLSKLYISLHCIILLRTIWQVDSPEAMQTQYKTCDSLTAMSIMFYRV